MWFLTTCGSRPLTNHLLGGLPRASDRYALLQRSSMFLFPRSLELLKVMDDLKWSCRLKLLWLIQARGCKSEQRLMCGRFFLLVFYPCLFLLRPALVPSLWLVSLLACMATDSKLKWAVLASAHRAISGSDVLRACLLTSLVTDVCLSAGLRHPHFLALTVRSEKCSTYHLFLFLVGELIQGRQPDTTHLPNIPTPARKLRVLWCIFPVLVNLAALGPSFLEVEASTVPGGWQN